MSDEEHGEQPLPERPSQKPGGADELESELRSMLRRPEAAPDLLSGFQRKLRERSRGKFYADGWSTSRHAPTETYLITSLIMLAVLAVIYALLAPLSGWPRAVENQPAPVPVRIVPPKQAP